MNDGFVFRELKKVKPFFTRSFSVRCIGGSGLKIGIIANKKLGNAVFRNKCKRRMKNAIDLFLASSTDRIDKSIVVVLRKEVFDINFADLLHDTMYVFGKKLFN